MSSSEPRRYLIAIGSSECPKIIPNSKLEHVSEDIRKITELFVDQGYERVLADQIGLDSDAEDIKRAVSNWFASQERQPTDCVVIYYGGHGDEGGRFGSHYLFTFNSREENLNDKAIETKEFVKRFFPADRNRSPQNILFILDTCYAKEGGRQISQGLSELKEGAPEGSGFWLICSSDINTMARDGAFVEALCQVMQSDDDRFQQCGEHIPVSTLVEWVNEYFKEKGQTQRAIPYSQGGQKESIFIRNPRRTSETKEQVSKLIKCLESLDYRKQTVMFEENTEEAPRSRRAAAFVVQAKDYRIQYWLVNRLYQKLQKLRNARVFSFEIPSHPMTKTQDFNEFWEDFSKKLKCEADPETVIEKLVEIYQTKSVIVAMYDWENSARSRGIQTQVLQGFWQELVDKASALSNQQFRTRLILFLAKNTTQRSKDFKHMSTPIQLAPLTAIPVGDLEKWFDSDSVCHVLGEERIELLVREEIANWQTDPTGVLKQICYIFGLTNGIADIEEEWRLVG